MTARSATDVQSPVTPGPGRRFDVVRVLAWCVLVGAFVLPPDGTGIPMCASKFITGVPCPGCGLTRSVCSLARGRVGQSWSYHPFGAVAIVLAGWAALGPLIIGRDRVDRLHARRPVRRAGVLLLGAFLAFGFVRAGRWILEGDVGAAGVLEKP